MVKALVARIVSAAEAVDLIRTRLCKKCSSVATGYIQRNRRHKLKTRSFRKKSQKGHVSFVWRNDCCSTGRGNRPSAAMILCPGAYIVETVKGIPFRNDSQFQGQQHAGGRV